MDAVMGEPHFRSGDGINNAIVGIHFKMGRVAAGDVQSNAKFSKIHAMFHISTSISTNSLQLPALL